MVTTTAADFVPPTEWGKAIQLYMRRFDLNQTQVAAVLEERVQRVHDWFVGRSEPADDVKPKLIKKLGIEPRKVAPVWMQPVIGDLEAEIGRLTRELLDCQRQRVGVA